APGLRRVLRCLSQTSDHVESRDRIRPDRHGRVLRPSRPAVKLHERRASCTKSPLDGLQTVSGLSPPVRVRLMETVTTATTMDNESAALATKCTTIALRRSRTRASRPGCVKPTVSTEVTDMKFKAFRESRWSSRAKSACDIDSDLSGLWRTPRGSMATS